MSLSKVNASLVNEISKKNLIINGNFQVSQRGTYTSATSLTTSSVYYLDRFKSKCDGVTGTITHKVDQSVNGKITDTVLLSSTSTATGRLETLQIIEDIQQFKGQATSFSAWVKSNNANARIVIHTDGSNVQTSSTTHTGGGAWELLKGTVTNATNISNMNLYCGIQAAGTGNISGVASGDYFEMTFLQVEMGSVSTDFKHRSYGEELALCQRYYCETNNLPNGSLRASGYAGGGTTGGFTFDFPVTMRAVPTGSWTNGQTLYANNGAAASVITTLGSTSASVTSSDINLIWGSSYTSNSIAFYTGAFSAKTSFNFDAEL